MNRILSAMVFGVALICSTHLAAASSSTTTTTWENFLEISHSVELSAPCPNGVYKEWGVPSTKLAADALEDVVDEVANEKALFDNLAVSRFFWGKNPKSGERMVVAKYCPTEHPKSSPLFSFPLTVSFSSKAACDDPKGTLFSAEMTKMVLTYLSESSSDVMALANSFYWRFKNDYPGKNLQKIVIREPESDLLGKVEAWYCESPSTNK